MLLERQSLVAVGGASLAMYSEWGRASLQTESDSVGCWAEERGMHLGVYYDMRHCMLREMQREHKGLAAPN